MTPRSSSAIALTEQRPTIHHQSITDLEALPEYRRSLLTAAAMILGDHVDVVVHGVHPGTYPEGVPPIVALRSAWIHHLLETQVVHAALQGARDGADAITIGCFFDPGVEVLRQSLDIPVLPACETAILAATADGGKCALVALDVHQQTFLERLVDGYGMGERVIWVRSIDPPVTEPELEGTRVGSELLRRISSLAAQAAKDGAVALVPAEGALNALLARSGVANLAGLPVIDSTASLFRRAEAVFDERDLQSRKPNSDLSMFEHFESLTGAVLSSRRSQTS